MLSVEAFQASETLVDVTPVERRLPGAVGGWVSSCCGGVLTVTTLLASDTFGVASLANTVKSYSVFGVRPVAVAVSWLPATEVTNWPCWYTSYAATPTLSVAASQTSDTVVGVDPVERRLRGGVGFSVSGGPVVP